MDVKSSHIDYRKWHESVDVNVHHIGKYFCPTHTDLQQTEGAGWCLFRGGNGHYRAAKTRTHGRRRQRWCGTIPRGRANAAMGNLFYRKHTSPRRRRRKGNTAAKDAANRTRFVSGLTFFRPSAFCVVGFSSLLFLTMFTVTCGRKGAWSGWPLRDGWCDDGPRATRMQ